MISATRRWFKRNRTTFAVGAAVVGAGYVVGQYVVTKVTEARQRMAEERIAKENLRRRFEQNQEDCMFTVLALLPSATEELIDALPVEQITNELQQKRAERLGRSVGPSEIASTVDAPSAAPSVADEDSRSLKSFQSESFIHASQVQEGSEGSSEPAPQSSPKRKTKVQLWNEMKIGSITRAFTFLYTLSLLSLLTRIQLNLLGRRSYLSSVVSLASPPPSDSRISLEDRDDENYEQAYGNDFETNRKYLTFSWWLLHRGCKQVLEEVQKAVEETFGSLNPREEITLQRLSELTVDVRKKVEGTTEEERRTKKWLPFLLPPQDQEAKVLEESGISPHPSPPAVALAAPDPTPTDPITPALRRLLDETSDLIDSPSFTHVLTLLLDATFSHLIDQKIGVEAFKIPTLPIAQAGPRIIELASDTPATAKAKVASILAVFCRQAHVIGSAGAAISGAALEAGPGGGNEYLARIEEVKGLEAFAAVVYSSNFEFEGLPDQDVEAIKREIKADTEAVPPAGTETESVDGKDVPGGEASLLGAQSGFEAAWGKALQKEEETSGSS